MALPHLLKYVYTHGGDEVIRRGKKIHAIGFVELVENDYLFGSAVFRVRDDIYSTFYKVYISNYKDPKTLSLRCACPYNLGDICRHEAAALIRLQEMIDKGMLESETVVYDQRHTVARMKTIDLKTIHLLSSHDIVSEAENYLKTEKPVIETAKEETVKATVTIEGQDFFVTIRKWDKEKNKLLEAYGYSLEDDLKGKFEFNYKDGKPFLRVLDPSIKRIAAPQTSSTPHFERVTAVEEEEPVSKEQIITKRLGVVFNFNKAAYPFFAIDVIEGEMDEEK